MPELTATHFAIITVLFAAGGVLGWIMRGDRSARERIAVNAGWQERVEAQETEQARLAEQNTRLMQAVSQHQASERDTTRRIKDLAQSLKAAVARRDELQRQVKDLRSDLEEAIAERDRLQADIRGREARGETAVHTLREKDEKIFKLSRELTSWQNRLPPLIAKFRERDQEAKVLRARLEEAESRIAEFESRSFAGETRIEPSGPADLPNGLDASNDQYEEVSEVDLSDLQDQIADDDEAAVPGPVPEGASQLASHANGSGTMQPASNLVASPAPAGKDDLQRIKGVGPAIERTLHDLGIFRFDQIARITEYDINRIAERLKGFRSRIYREDWIGQARTLHDLRQTDPA